MLYFQDKRLISWEVRGKLKIPLDPVTTESEKMRSNYKIESNARSFAESINPFYVSGYIDGEGCFSVSFSPRKKLLVGWEVRPSFSVSQNYDRSEVIDKLIEFFGCGSIRPDRSDQTLKYEVRSITELVENVIPHFQKYPLKSSKQK